MRKMRHIDRQIYPVRIVSCLSEREHLFALMVSVLGYSATKAYRLAINPDVSVNSAASLGCRLLSEPRIQYYIHKLYRERNSFVFSGNAYKYQ